jgi:hypothetical protein
VNERRRLAVVGLVSLLLALWMDLSPLHRFHDSDSLVPVLMSLQRWTPFYWEQNRFGSLLPLLAIPVHGPYHNLLVQVGLRLLAVVLSFFLLARLVVPRAYWPAVGAATFALYVAGKGQYAHCFLQMQPYPQAAALGLGGLAALGDCRRIGRIGAGVLLIGLAFWISPSILFWLFSLMALRWVLGMEREAAGAEKGPHPRPLSRLPPPFPRERGEKRQKRFSRFFLSPLSRWGRGGSRERGGGEGLFRRLLPFALLCTAFVASVLVTRYFAPWAATDLGVAKVSTWPHAWAALAVGLAKFLGVPLALAAAVLAGCAAAARRSARARLAAAVGLCLLAPAAAELLALGTSSWVHLNDLTIRFLCCGLLSAGMALPALAAVVLLEGRPGWQRIANAVAFAALVPVVFLRFGPPSPAAARAAFDRHVGPAAPALVAAGCTHVLGSYWRVWPAALRADQILWERGVKGQVWGITTRSRPTRDLWQPRSWTAARVGVIRDDAVAATAMSFYSVPPLFLVETAPGLRVYSGTPPPGAAVVSFPPVTRGPSAVSVAPSQEPRP